MSNRLGHAVPSPLAPIEGLRAILEAATPEDRTRIELILEHTLLLVEAVTRPEARTSAH